MAQPPESRSRPRRVVSLWSLVESLQRRLERQGLSEPVVDVAVVHALTNAVRGRA